MQSSFEKEDALEAELIEYYGKFISNKCDTKELYKLYEDLTEYYVNFGILKILG